MSLTHIVIPIGVSSPGTPVFDLLTESINSVLSQTDKNYVLTIASDDNIPVEIKLYLETLQSTGILRIKWFDKHSFFRPGGIWKKITDCWKEIDSEYVAFLHYDDVWDKEKLMTQVNLMESENLNSSFSECYMIDEKGKLLSGDAAHWETLGSTTLGSRTMAFPHTVIVKKASFFDSGIMKYESRWSACFEDIFTIYLHKIGKSKKAPGAKFFWRNHPDNMSNTLCLWTQPESIWRDTVISQQESAGYSDEMVSSDHKAVMSEIREEIKTWQ